MKLVYEVLKDVKNRNLKADKIKILQENESWALKDILRGSMDSTITWNVPDGEPPYTPNEPQSVPSNLLKKHRDFRFIVKGGEGDKMRAYERESKYVQLLESIHPEDAKLVIDMVSKKKPPGVSRPVVDEAFPGLIRESN